MIVCSEHDSSIYRSFDDENMRSVQLQQCVGKKNLHIEGKVQKIARRSCLPLTLDGVVCGGGE